MELHTTARAIATACRWPPESARHGTLTEGMRIESRSSSAAQRRSISRRASQPNQRSDGTSCSRPMNRLSLTLTSGASARSWNTVSMPSRRESSGEPKGCSTPSTATWPAVGRIAPLSTPTRVDLPAPLSPTRPTTSPGEMPKVTSSSAWAAP